MAGDALLSASAVMGSYALQPYFSLGWSSSNPTQPGAVPAASMYAFAVVLSLHVFGLYEPTLPRRFGVALLRVCLGALGAAALCLSVLYLISLQQFGRTILLRMFLGTVFLLSLVRSCVWASFSTSPRIIGVVLAPTERLELERLVCGARLPVRLVASSRDAANAEFLINTGVHEVVASIREPAPELWQACLSRGVQVTDVGLFVERELGRVLCVGNDISWFLSADLKWNHPFYHRIKRLADIAFAALGILAAIPIVAVAAIAVLLESGAPIFYSQERVGFRGRGFRIYKLRSMRTDAESGTPKWARQGDSRITCVGAFLRRTRVDELPQFWNVLIGDMSIIGPRPERPEFVAALSAKIPLYAERHWIKPGITGWAQINYPYGASVEDAREKLAYDLFYLKHASITTDLGIALRTIGAIAKGAR